MKRAFNFFYWISVIIILFLLYGNKTDGLINAFYFISFLVPIALVTSWYFNNSLIPDYFLKKKYFRFIILTLFTIIISLDLIMIVVFIAFVFIARFQPDSLGDLISHYYSFPLIIYLAVIVNGFFNLALDYMKIIEDLKTLSESKNDFESGQLRVRSNRQNVNINYRSINYIESMSDYVLIRTKDKQNIMTRETISRIEQILPPSFLRIHRSFIINLENVDSFTREYIITSEKELPISRTYRKKVYEVLKM